MNITNAHYTDASATSIAASVDGIDMTIPAAPGNRHYEALLAEGVTIAAYEAPPVGLKAKSADLRYNVEISGTTWNGHSIDTDRESQPKVQAERLAILTGDRIDGDPWKLKDGTMLFPTNAEMEQIATAVRDHVKAAFSKEGQCNAEIDAGTITTTTEVEAFFDG